MVALAEHILGIVVGVGMIAIIVTASGFTPKQRRTQQNFRVLAHIAQLLIRPGYARNVANPGSHAFQSLNGLLNIPIVANDAAALPHQFLNVVAQDLDMVLVNSAVMSR